MEGKLPAVAPTSQELAAEVRRLRARLQSVTNQRDILKKAVGTARVELGRVEHALGDTAQFRGDFAEMMRWYRQSLETFAQLACVQPSESVALDELARAYDTLGDGLSRTENGHAEQTTCFVQELAIRQKVVAQVPGNVKYQRGLAVAFLKLGRTTLRDPAHGVADIVRGVDMMKALADENPENAGLRSAYVLLLYELGVAQTETGDHAGALASFAQVLRSGNDSSPPIRKTTRPGTTWRRPTVNSPRRSRIAASRNRRSSMATKQSPGLTRS